MSAGLHLHPFPEQQPPKADPAMESRRIYLILRKIASSWVMAKVMAVHIDEVEARADLKALQEFEPYRDFAIFVPLEPPTGGH